MSNMAILILCMKIYDWESLLKYYIYKGLSCILQANQP